MFEIYDGRNTFFQWDINRKLIVNDSINQVHFCNKTDDCSLVCEVYEENGQRLVNVPNILLQEDWRINVYGYDKDYTKHSVVFDVVKRSKPADYVYTETEILKWDDIEAKVDSINNNIGASVTEYLDENPIEVDLSDYYTKAETNTAIEEAVAAIPEVDLSGYALKSEIPSTSGLATEQYVNSKIEAIPKTDLSEYAKKSDIPSINGLATEDYVNSAIENIPEVDLTDYAKRADIPSITGLASETYVNESIEAIDIPDITGLASEKYVEDKIAAIPATDLSEYAKKSEIPSTTGLATEAYVNAQIEAIPAVDLTDYAKKAEIPDTTNFITMAAVEAKGYQTEAQAKQIAEDSINENVDLTVFYTKSEADSAIERAINDIPEVDLSEYAKKTELPSTTGFIKITDVEAKGYQTEAQVIALINNSLGVIENGSY